VVVLILLVARRAFFGTWGSGLMLAGVVGFAGMLVYGEMAIAGVAVDLLSTGLFLMLSVAAVERSSASRVGRGRLPTAEE